MSCELLWLKVPVGWVDVDCWVGDWLTSPSNTSLGLARRFLSPVPGTHPVSGLDRLDAALGWPVVFEGGARGEMSLDFLQSNHLRDDSV